MPSYTFSWDIAIVAIFLAAVIMYFAFQLAAEEVGVVICIVVYIVGAGIALIPDNAKADDDLTATQTAERVYNMPVGEAVPLVYSDDSAEGFQLVGYSQTDERVFVDFSDGDTTSKLSFPTTKIEFVTSDDSHITVNLSDEEHEDYDTTFGTVSYTPQDKSCHIDTIFYTCPYTFSESAHAEEGLTLAYLVDITLERVTITLPADVYEELGL